MPTEKLVVNCLPLLEEEQTAFAEAAGGRVAQVFAGDPAQRHAMTWAPHIPVELRERATAVIGNVPPSELAACPNLAWLQTNSAGVAQYQAPGVLPGGAVLTSASGAYGQAVSEGALAMTLALMKNLHLYRTRQLEGTWHDEGAATSPAGARVLVVGTGDIGAHYARLMKALGAHTLGIRRNAATDVDGIDEMHGFGALDELLPTVDVVALFVPDTPQTRGLIDARRLALMAPEALLVNCGRGTAVDTDALVAALAAGQIRGAALDVTDPEPLPAGHPLWAEPRCLITPHVTGGNHLEATTQRIFTIARDNLRRYATGELRA